MTARMPLGDLSTLSIPVLIKKYGATEVQIISMREQHGMTRAQRSAKRWCPDRMRENLRIHSDENLSLIYDLPVVAIKMIRELAS